MDRPKNAAYVSLQNLARRLALVAALGAAAACGSSEGESADPVPAPGAPSNASPAPNTMGSAEAGASSQTPASPAAGSETVTPAPSAPAAEAGATPPSLGAAAVGDACAALAGDDACGACVCGECSGALDECAGTPGCPEILACVRGNGCSGSECYCGDARLSECFDGQANGPCKDVVLAAPGGQEPSLENPSGGPASDAALAVGECAEDDDRCADVCDLSD